MKEPQRFSREELEVACADAHMTGRVYHEGGEKRLPGEEHTYMIERAIGAVKQHRARLKKEGR